MPKFLFLLWARSGTIFFLNTRKDELFVTCVSCKEVRLICPDFLKQCVSRALFHPEIASESNFHLKSHEVMLLQQFTMKQWMM